MLCLGMSKLEPVIIGWGSQAKAWALNLRDSEIDLCIGLRKESPSFDHVKEMGFKALELGKNLGDFQVFILLIPDHQHALFFENYSQFLKESACIIYAHGASLIQNNLTEKFPQFHHLLLAPKAIASEVRFSYQTGKKLGACSHAKTEEHYQMLRELATAIGIGEVLVRTNFQEETYADLFSEQSVLCSLLPYGALHSFNELRARGVQPEIAYMECWLEVKLIAKAMIEMGPTDFFSLISPNALLGGEKAQKMIFDKAYQEKLKRLSSEIWDGTFFKEVDCADFEKVRAQVEAFWKDSELEKVHQQIHNKLN